LANFIARIELKIRNDSYDIKTDQRARVTN